MWQLAPVYPIQNDLRDHHNGRHNGLHNDLQDNHDDNDNGTRSQWYLQLFRRTQIE